MSGRVTRVLESLAQSIGVAESDFLILRHHRLVNAESLAYRLPSSQDLEDFLREEIYPNSAFDCPQNGLLIYPRAAGEFASFAAFRRSEDAGALRKLWEASNGLAKRELETLTAESSDSAFKVLSAVVSQDMIARAIQNNWVIPLPHDKTPGRSTLGLVMKNHSLGGQHRYIAW